VAAIADTPKVMTEGNWRLGVFVDENATDEQADKLVGVFSGALGGPMAALGRSRSSTMVCGTAFASATRSNSRSRTSCRSESRPASPFGSRECFTRSHRI
jgi:hypothetical protein